MSRTTRSISRNPKPRNALLALILAGAGLAIAQRALAGKAAAQTEADDLSHLSLEELMDIPVVVTGEKSRLTPRQTPASVSLVYSQEIELFGYRNLADILRNQRGFYIDPNGLNTLVGTRGFLRPGEWNFRTLVLVDGRPTRENIYSQTHIDQDFVVPIEAIKNVEIIRGPGSSLYGGNAVFGVINVVTKDGADLNGGLVRLSGGTDETARLAAMYGTRTSDGWDIIGGGAAYTSQGDRDILYDNVNDPALNDGHIRGADYEGADALFFKVKKGDFTGTFDLETRNRDNRAATYLASFFNPGSMHEDRANVTLRFDHDIARDQSFHAMAWYGHYNYRQTYSYDADPATQTPAYRYITSGLDDWMGEEIHYDAQLTQKFHLLVGADATQSLFDIQRDHDEIDGTLLDINNSYNSWGVFTNAEYKPEKWLTFMAGLRIDGVQRMDTQFSPRAAALLMPTRDDTIKLLYGRAFRAPNLYELFYYSPQANKPNPKLEPEVVDTYEIVYERQFADGWNTSLGTYLWRMSDSLGDRELGDGSLLVTNTGTAWGNGIEAEISRHWTSGATLRAYGTLGHAQDSNNDHLTHSPDWTIGLSAALPLFKDNFLAVDSQIVGPMLSDLGEDTNPTYITNLIYTSRNIGRVKGLELQVALYNLFADQARLPRDNVFNQVQPTLNWPRTQLMVTLTYRF